MTNKKQTVAIREVKLTAPLVILNSNEVKLMKTSEKAFNLRLSAEGAKKFKRLRVFNPHEDGTLKDGDMLSFTENLAEGKKFLTAQRVKETSKCEEGIILLLEGYSGVNISEDQKEKVQIITGNPSNRGSEADYIFIHMKPGSRFMMYAGGKRYMMQLSASGKLSQLSTKYF